MSFPTVSKTCWRVPSPVYCASSPLLPWGKSLCLPKPVAPSGSSCHACLSAPLSWELYTETGLRERTLQTQPIVSVVSSRLRLPCLGLTAITFSQGFPHFFSQEREKNKTTSFSDPPKSPLFYLLHSNMLSASYWATSPWTTGAGLPRQRPVCMRAWSCLGMNFPKLQVTVS